MDDRKYLEGAEDAGGTRRYCMPAPPPAESFPQVAPCRPGEDPLLAKFREDLVRYRGGAPGVVANGRPSPSQAEVQQHIRSVCDGLRDFLIGKNEAYGNSALEPINVFSKLSAREGILIRCDDKLKRIKNGKNYPGDDNVKDLAGYIILLMVLEEIDNV